MRNESIVKAFKIIQLLMDDRNRSVTEICDKLSMSRRTFYYLIEFLRTQDIIIFKCNGCYHIDRRSPFITRLTHAAQFSDDELLTIRNLIGMMGEGNATVDSLRRKFDSSFDFTQIINNPERQRQTSIAKKLTRAIRDKRMVRIEDYSSPHSNSVTDRVVEPFMLMNDSRDVRCYELATGVNKTFKIARMGGVEILDTPWIHEGEHRQVFTDIFMFSGEERHHIKIRVNHLARNLFLEEFPQGRRYVSPSVGLAGSDSERWIIELDVCDFRGIGRFVLGLYNNINILADDDFEEYINDEIKIMTVKNHFDNIKIGDPANTAKVRAWRKAAGLPNRFGEEDEVSPSEP